MHMNETKNKQASEQRRKQASKMNRVKYLNNGKAGLSIGTSEPERKNDFNRQIFRVTHKLGEAQPKQSSQHLRQLALSS